MPAGYQFAPAADWVKELLRRGHHVTVYTTAVEAAKPLTFEGDHLRIRIAPQRASGTGRDLFAVERVHLARMMAEDRCEVIHAHWTYQFALAALTTEIPTLVTIHDLPWNVLRHFRDLHRAARLVMAYQVAQRAEHFTAVSEDAARHFRRYMRPRGSVTVIPNGLPDDIVDGAEMLRTDRGSIVFATILQGWSTRKNGSKAIEAFARLRAEVPSVELRMYGTDYEPGGPAQRWAVARSLQDGITFAGQMPYRELLKRVAAEIDVVVHPSLDESFSMAALEAMAMRRPVIAGAATPGVREVLEYGKSGVLTDMHDTAALAEAMRRLARDEDERIRLGELGHERASTVFRLSAVFDRYEEQYARLGVGGA
ncbi:MAG TPA: glycosyltransferase family 4 protein [Terracidiphilus sp.]|nr:glycosyltransferase family 4 protein [Terracidiphilus sp.]